MTAHRPETVAQTAILIDNRPPPPSRRATAKALLLAFGPLLLLTALGLIGAREASVGAREAMNSGRADVATHAFVGDRNGSDDDRRHD
jgi:hypothetical protein